MTTTTVLSEDTATIVREDAGSFNWPAALAGSVVATALTFFLVSVGAGFGLAMVTAYDATQHGLKAFLTLGAVYFVAANAFGFAVGGHMTGRLLGPAADDSEEEHFWADAHGLAVWGLGVVFGVALLGLVSATGIAATSSTKTVATPVAYWTDKLFEGAQQQVSLSYRQYAQADAPTVSDLPNQAITPSGAAAGGNVASTPSAIAMPNGQQPNTSSPASLADVKDEASRLLTAEAAKQSTNSGEDHETLVRLVSEKTGLTASVAEARVNSVENRMRQTIRDAAEVARKTASYVAIWTALALLFSAIVCVAATVSARWKDDHDIFGRPRPNRT